MAQPLKVVNETSHAPFNYLPSTGYTEISRLPGGEPGSPPVPLSHYIWIFHRSAWKIITFVSVCVLATAVVSARLHPIYESTASVNVDRQSPSEVVGQDSNRAIALNDADQFLATQVRLIQSDAVLRPVAERFRLLEEEGQVQGANAEKLEAIRKAPVILSRLRVSRPPNTYLLLISYRSTSPTLAATVANAIANSYLADTYRIRTRSSNDLTEFMQRQLGDLQAEMEKSGLALAQFEKELDVVNPEEKTNILSARLLQINTEYTAAQADRVAKQAAWNAVQSGSIESAQVSSQGADLAKLSDNLRQAQQRFALIQVSFGPTHPEYRKAASEVAEIQKQFDEVRGSVADRIGVEYRQALNREEMLQKTVADTKAECDHLNSKSFEYQQLKRTADADKNLYDELIQKIREANVNDGFQNNSIRIADIARPALAPVFPNFKVNLAIALLFSILLAAGAVLLQDTLDTTLRDPGEAGRFLGTDVIGTLPMDREMAQLLRLTAPGIKILPRSQRKTGRKRQYQSTTEFEEAVCAIRNTIHLSATNKHMKSIMLTSASPDEGKSTLAAHLAIANADRGKTLLIDADLRHPSQHSQFGLPSREGLSNVLMGELSWQEAVRPVEGRPHLSLLTSGSVSHSAADLIGPRLSMLLDEFVKEYDLIILDCPPLLGFAECLQMAAAADGVLIVGLAGVTKRGAVAEVIQILNRVRAHIIGVVLNQVSPKTTADGYPYHRCYRYSRYRTSAL